MIWEYFTSCLGNLGLLCCLHLELCMLAKKLRVKYAHFWWNFFKTLISYTLICIRIYVNSQGRVGSFHWTYLVGSFRPKCKSAMYSNVTQLELLTPSVYIFSVQLSKNTQILPSNTIFSSCVIFHCMIFHLIFFYV